MPTEEQTTRRVREALNHHLKPPLSAFVSAKMLARYGPNWRENMSRAGHGGPASGLDTHALLKTMIDNWRGVFGDAVDGNDRHRARNFTSWVLDARNALAHEDVLGDADGLRYLDAMLGLARCIKAPDAAVTALERLYNEQRAPGPRYESMATPAGHATRSPPRGRRPGDRGGFKEYLLTDFDKAVVGGPLTTGSANSYCSYINKLEEALATDLDNEDLSETGLDSIIHRLRAVQGRLGVSDKTITNWSSGLRAYAAYRLAAPSAQ